MQIKTWWVVVGSLILATLQSVVVFSIDKSFNMGHPKALLLFIVPLICSLVMYSIDKTSPATKKIWNSILCLVLGGWIGVEAVSFLAIVILVLWQGGVY